MRIKNANVSSLRFSIFCIPARDDVRGERPLAPTSFSQKNLLQPAKSIAILCYTYAREVTIGTNRIYVP